MDLPINLIVFILIFSLVTLLTYIFLNKLSKSDLTINQNRTENINNNNTNNNINKW